MRSPSRIRPSLAAMLFGSTCTGQHPVTEHGKVFTGNGNSCTIAQFVKVPFLLCTQTI